MFAHLIVLGLLGQADGAAPDPAALLERLGTARKAEQEAAKTLEGLGAKALPALRAARKSKDPDVRSRARVMIRTIEGSLLTKASPVRLAFENATPGDVARSLSREVGFDVGIGAQGPDPGALRITIHEPRPIPFWDAIDRICEAAPLSFTLQGQPRRGSGAPPSLTLSYRPEPSMPPSSNQGPFHVTVESLYFQSQVSYQGAARPVGRPMLDMGRTTTTPAKGAGPRAQPDRIVQFHVRLRLVAEPRMTVRQAGQIRLAEAVDDLGNSLLPPSNENDPSPGGGGMAMMEDRPSSTFLAIGTTTLMTNLRRPDRPGKVVRNLKGAFDVVVAAHRPDPLIIPIAGAPNRTFENDEWRVLVKSIEMNDNGGQHVIELQVDDLEEQAGDGTLDGPIAGIRGGLVREPGSMAMFGPNSTRGSIQVVMAGGQNASYQWTTHRNSGRITLKVNAAPPGGAIKEIRIASQIVARTKVTFEFHDLPMP